MRMRIPPHIQYYVSVIKIVAGAADEYQVAQQIIIITVIIFFGKFCPDHLY